MTTDYAATAGTDAIATALDLNANAKDKKSSASASAMARSFLRTEEPPREPEAPSQAKVLPLPDKPANFNHVGDNILFIGYKTIDHIRHFRAAYTRRPIENRGHVTEIFVAAVHTVSRDNTEIETITRSFATPMEAETFILMHYASVELPDLMFDVLGTTHQHNEDALRKIEADFVNNEFAAE